LPSGPNSDAMWISDGELWITVVVLDAAEAQRQFDLGQQRLDRERLLRVLERARCGPARIGRHEDDGQVAGRFGAAHGLASWSPVMRGMSMS